MAHPFVPVPNTARIELIYLYNGVTMENVINVNKGSPYTLAQLQAVRTIVNNWDAASWQGSRSNNAYLVRIRTKALDTASSPTEDFYLPAARPGTINGQTLPGNSTFAIKLTTGLAGRSFRGRWYMVGLCAPLLGPTANQVTAASAATLVGWLNLLQANLAAGGHTLCVLSYRSGGVYRAAGLVTPALNWTAVDLNVDSMRRRLTGRGI